MTLHVRDVGVWKEVTAPAVRDVGVWKNLTEGHVRDLGIWKIYFGGGPALSASAAPASVSEFGFDFGGGVDVYSPNVTCTPSGGSGGYTYQWQHVSGSTFNIAPPANNTATVQFWYTLYGFQTRVGVYRCSVNDSASNGPVYTGNVTITLDSEA